MELASLQILLFLPLTFAVAEPFIFQVPTKVVLEAEDTPLAAPFEVVEVRGASRGKAVSLPPRAKLVPYGDKEKNTGDINYSFSVPEDGRYFVWFRVLHFRPGTGKEHAERTRKNWEWLGHAVVGSFEAFFESETKSAQELPRERAALSQFVWQKLPSPVRLNTGKHVMTLRANVPGIIVDRIAIIELGEGRSRDDQYIPVAIER